MIICFGCVVGLTLSAKDENENGDSKSSSFSANMIYGVIISFIAGWCFAMANIMNRKLKGVNPGLVLFYPASMGSVGLLIFFIIRLIVTGKSFFVYEN